MNHGYFKVVLIVTMISQASSIDQRLQNFRCNNGKYIFNNLFCNGYNNCGDNSDEYYGCLRNSCGSGKFKCADGPCLPITIRCNSKKDCSDGLDELNCGDETDIEDCFTHRGRYLCDDKLKCIRYNLTCDGYCNCFDCSDEKSGCLNNEYSSSTFDSEACFATPNGLQCCSELNSLCRECSTDVRCDQKCFRFQQQERCLCDENYQAVSNTNKSKCSSKDSYDDILIYTTSSDIKLLNLTSKSKYALKNAVDCTALTAAHQYVYYGTFQNNKGYIFKISIASKTQEEFIQSNSSITSIAVDWITNNVYFTTNTSLSVCTNDGKICNKLKSESTRNLNLAPRFGLMFWTQETSTEGDEQNVIKSAMDGSQEKFLIYYISFSPILLVVDELTEKIYWLDVDLGEIRSSTFKGNNRKTWYLNGHGNMFSFSIFETKLFFTKKDKFNIYSVEQSKEPVILESDLGSAAVKFVYAFNPSLQKTKITNPCISSCNGLCLLRPSLFKNFLNHTCIQTAQFQQTESTTEPKRRYMEQNFSSKSTAHHNYLTTKHPDYLVVPSASSFQNNNLLVYSIIFLGVAIAVVVLGIGLYYGYRKWTSSTDSVPPLIISEPLGSKRNNTYNELMLLKSKNYGYNYNKT